MAAGIEKRHARACRSRDGQRCNCEPTYRASVWDRWRSVRVRHTFPSEAAAKTWRHDAITALRSGALIVAPEARPLLSDALDALIEGMEQGRLLDRSGKPYKPSTRRSYKIAADKYLKPRIGHLRVPDVRRRDVQALVDELRAEGLAASTVHNKLDVLRVVFRRAVRDEIVAVDPTDNLELPAVRGRRERVESPERAGALLESLPESERAAWSVAFYCGLRVGELRALRWADVDLSAGTIHVRRGWDDQEGEIALKSDAGRRRVPLVGMVRRELVRHKLATGRDGDDLVFGRTATAAFVRSTLRARALRSWTAAGLDPLTPHEARHTCASYLIAAGLNPKQVQTYIGHSDIRTTYNVYGHLMPGDEGQAATQLEAFLTGSAGQLRDSQPAI